MREFILQKNTLVRGLAHPMVFNDRDANPLMASTLKKYGAVEVSPSSIFEVSRFLLIAYITITCSSITFHLLPLFPLSIVLYVTSLYFTIHLSFCHSWYNFTFFWQLLRRNETVMLFPGGIREALHGKGEEYKLFWWVPD